jgi:hypothetical protein
MEPSFERELQFSFDGIHKGKSKGYGLVTASDYLLGEKSTVTIDGASF